MLKKIIIIFLLTILAPLNAIKTQAVPADNGKIVRAGISDNNFSKYYFQTAEVSATDAFTLTDKFNNRVITNPEANTIVTVQMHDGLFDIYTNGKETASDLRGPIEVSSNNGFVYVPGLKRAGAQSKYRGTFELSPSKDNKFSIVNVLDLESYLRGVVPNEMPVRFGLEALKAQTVTARNYVLKPRENNYHNFDVCDSVACQVYFGAGTEKELSDRAIVETENIVAMYDADLILALYSSTAGGYTESYENAFSEPGSKTFPASPKPYLQGVPDNDRVPLLDTEGAVRKFYQDTPATFDNKSPYFRWTRDWNGTELENVLKKTLKANSNTGFIKPALVNEADFGKLKDIKVIKRGVSGKAMIIEIKTDKGVFLVQKELVIRRVFQNEGKALPSANIIFDVDKTPRGFVENVRVTGGGFGHGVGMSQYGAGMMCAMGYSYEDILRHYYSGISVATYPITLTNMPGKDTAAINVYTKNQKTELIVENKFQFTNLIVVMNQRQLKMEIAPHPFKPARFDLTPYALSGKNRLTFILPCEDNHRKSVRLYLELNSK